MQRPSALQPWVFQGFPLGIGARARDAEGLGFWGEKGYFGGINGKGWGVREGLGEECPSSPPPHFPRIPIGNPGCEQEILMGWDFGGKKVFWRHEWELGYLVRFWS